MPLASLLPVRLAGRAAALLVVAVGSARVAAAAAERVEQAHPELVGGVGIYRGTRAHGPFVHIDTRGRRARWGAG